MASQQAADRTSWVDVALISLSALSAFVFCLVSSTVFADGDTNTHVATGLWILAHHAVPASDPFSYTAIGRPWVPHEWLSEALMALTYTAAGWAGVRVLTALAAAAVMALLAARLRQWLGALSVIASMALVFTVLARHFLARPHLIALPLLALWIIEILRARQAGRLPSLWLLPLMVLWANLHGSDIIGLALAAPFALEAFFDAGERRWIVGAQMEATFLVVAAALAALLTPLRTHRLPFHLVDVMSMTSLPSIGEWQSETFDLWSAFEGALILTLFVCLYRGVRIPAVRLGVLLLLLVMTLQHARQEIVLAVVGPLLLAEPLGRALAPEAGRGEPSIVHLAASETDASVPIAVGVVPFVALVAWRLAVPEVRLDRKTVPVTALAHVPAAVRATPVFNDPSFGGWFIFNGARPFIDGRADMYGDDFVKLYLDVDNAKPGVVDATFRRYGVAWTILSPTSPLVARVDAMPGWRRIYADKWAVVQVRGSPGPGFSALREHRTTMIGEIDSGKPTRLFGVEWRLGANLRSWRPPVSHGRGSSRSLTSSS